MSVVKRKRWTSIVSSLLFLTVLIVSIGWQPAQLYAEGENKAEDTKEPVEATTTQAPDLQVEALSAIIIEANTGQILYGLNENEALPPASMAKMMTEYIVMENIKSGNLAWDEIVTASKYADWVPGSGQLIAEGDKISVRNLFRSMSIYSGNDATVALAERIGGTEEKFVHMMNDKAKELGLSSEAHFSNATGLDPSSLGEYAPNIPGVNLLTAHDAAKIARRIVLDHPEVLEMASQTRAYFIEGDESTPLMTNWNWMLEGWETDSETLKKFAYKGVDGLKTGFTNQAGYSFTGTAQRDGMRLITVVMNTGTTSEGKRFTETAKLMDYGFGNFSKKTLLTAKSEVEMLPKVPVLKGVALEVPLVTQDGFELVVNKAHGDERLSLQAESVDVSTIVAPIKQGDVLGSVKVVYTGDYGKIEEVINLVAAEDVEKAGWFKLLMRAIGDFFKDIFQGIKGLF